MTATRRKVVWTGAKALRRFLVPIADLEPFPGNPRRGDIDAIRASILRFGQVRAIVVDGTRIVAGHHLVLAAQAEGWTHVAAMPNEFGSDEEARAYLLADNRTSELGAIDDEALAEQLRALRAAAGLAGTGYTEQFARAHERKLEQLRLRAAGDDPTPDVPENPVSRVGEVYAIGRHRLLCGDALDALDVLYPAAKVGCVLTDPPYGISLDTDYSKFPAGSKMAIQGLPRKRHRPVHGDERAFDPAPYVEAFASVREQFWFGADYYRRSLSRDDRDGSWLVWDKRNEKSDTGIGSGFELIWSREGHKRDLLRHYFFGAFGVEGANRVHPTQKPTPLLVEILERWAPEGCIVADPFVGSGSTLLACEKSGRACYAAEIDPGYCDVVRRRYAELAGDSDATTSAPVETFVPVDRADLVPRPNRIDLALTDDELRDVSDLLEVVRRELDLDADGPAVLAALRHLAPTL